MVLACLRTCNICIKLYINLVPVRTFKTRKGHEVLHYWNGHEAVETCLQPGDGVIWDIKGETIAFLRRKARAEIESHARMEMISWKSDCAPNTISGCYAIYLQQLPRVTCTPLSSKNLHGVDGHACSQNGRKKPEQSTCSAHTLAAHHGWGFFFMLREVQALLSFLIASGVCHDV